MSQDIRLKAAQKKNLNQHSRTGLCAHQAVLAGIYMRALNSIFKKTPDSPVFMWWNPDKSADKASFFLSSYSRSFGGISPTGKGIQLEHRHTPRVNGDVDGDDAKKVQNESSSGLEQPEK